MTTTQVDLDDCAREPIHIPGAIQPHGALLVLNPVTLMIRQASTNASQWLGSELNVGAALPEFDGLRSGLGEWDFDEEASFEWVGDVGGRPLQAAAHMSGDRLVLEFEDVPSDPRLAVDRLFPQLRALGDMLAAEADTTRVLSETARFVRDITGFDRVLVYRFDDDWNGRVIAEDSNGNLPSYLDLRFPAGDIPAQARKLYTLNRIRIIPDAGYVPVPIEPADDAPLDLSFSLLRSVSPVHVEYMRNMGTFSSMSISIVFDGKLWGLIACHSREPNLVSLQVRSICDFAGRILASEIGSRARVEASSMRAGLSQVQQRLLDRMAAETDWRQALADADTDVLELAGASGFAIVDAEGEPVRVGLAPDPLAIEEIAAWLERQRVEDSFATRHLSAEMPGTDGMASVAAGLLAVRLSRLNGSWLMWFKPEVVRSVSWAGDPHKIVRESGRIHPRHSFDAWKAQEHLQAAAWTEPQIEAVGNLRRAVVGIILRKAEELAQMAEELQRSNRELEAFSYSVSHDLRAPFRHIVGYAELLRERENTLDDKSTHYLHSISEAALAAGQLVDDLLNFSQIGRTALAQRKVDMGKLVLEVRQSLELKTSARKVDWHVGALPHAYGDPTLLRQVWYNLVENAVKYTAPRGTARIDISGVTRDDSVEYSVSDNGVGFDMAYKEKLFGVFQRLQRAEDFEGTGIGLALCRRIIERHGGRIWARGELGEGATFCFSLPFEPEGD